MDDAILNLTTEKKSPKPPEQSAAWRMKPNRGRKLSIRVAPVGRIPKGICIWLGALCCFKADLPAATKLLKIYL
jgi:hypothetical protein